MEIHLTVLAWIYVAGAGLMGLAGLIALFASQFIFRLPIELPPDAPEGLVALVGSLVVFAALINLALAAGVAAAGYGLMQHTDWGRVCAIIMGAILAFWFPVGTALAVYTFWVLLSEEGRNHYSASTGQGAG